MKKQNLRKLLTKKHISFPAILFAFLLQTNLSYAQEIPFKVAESVENYIKMDKESLNKKKGEIEKTIKSKEDSLKWLDPKTDIWKSTKKEIEGLEKEKQELETKLQNFDNDKTKLSEKIQSLDNTKEVKENQEKIKNLESKKADRNEVYTKSDLETKLQEKADTGEVKNLSSKVEQQEKRISSLEKESKHLNEKINKGTAMLTAMANVDFLQLNPGDIGVGAGIGHFNNTQAVAVGVGYTINEDLHVHTKWSGVAGDAHYNAIGGGITYRFRSR